MQSSLKKSLYLGLAALSFASVASVTANSSNANAAKKHRAAKKVTYKTTDRNLDQSVVFTSTGKSAVYSKPGTVKGARVVATKADMGSKANSKSTGDQFMAYQSAVTSKGVHYYKVVSFDKKVRGYVYVGGVNKVDGKTSTATPSNTNGYLKSNRLFNVAYGSQFGAKLKNFNGINFSTDKFTVNDAVQVRNGAKYYNVTDQNNAMVNGWVNADFFSNEATDAVNQKANDAKAVKLTFYSSANNGVVLSSKTVQPNGGFYNVGSDSYTNDQMVKAIHSALVNSGYKYNNAYTDLTSNNANGAVKQGDNLNVNVTPSKSVTAKFSPYATNATGNSQLLNTSAMDNSAFPGISDAQLRELSAYENNTIPFDQFVNDFFGNGKVWNVIKQGGHTYTFDKDATMRAYNNRVNDAKNNSNYYGKYSSAYTFNDAFNNNTLPVYYNEDNTDKSSSVFDENNNYNTQQVIVSNNQAVKNTASTMSDSDRAKAAMDAYYAYTNDHPFVSGADSAKTNKDIVTVAVYRAEKAAQVKDADSLINLFDSVNFTRLGSAQQNVYNNVKTQSVLDSAAASAKANKNAALSEFVSKLSFDNNGNSNAFTLSRTYFPNNSFKRNANGQIEVGNNTQLSDSQKKVANTMVKAYNDNLHYVFK